MITDLKRRNVPFSPPDMTEAEAEEVKQAILSGWITTGPRTKKLEKLVAEYCHTERAVCLNSCTAAMEMALHLLDVGPGDEVIVPAYTYTATASVVEHVGATLVMIDSQPNRVEMDYDKMEAAITERTKVVMPVDLGGVMCDYDRVREAVERKKGLFRPKNILQRLIGRVAICADCAHAFGSQRLVKTGLSGWRAVKGEMSMAGEVADFSSFSFHAVKNLTTAEGGALTWNLAFGNEKVEGVDNSWVQREASLNEGGQKSDNFSNLSPYYPTVPRIEGETWNEMLYRLSQLFSLHGQNKDALAKSMLGAWEYDIIGPWYKCNMTDIMASLGLVQFERYPEMLKKRQKMVARYHEAFKDLNVTVAKHKGEGYCSSHHLYPVLLNGKTREETNQVIQQMAERGIATNVHYKPLPMMTAYKNLGFDIKDYPNAYRLFVNEMTLPLNTRMSEEDQEYVIENFIEVLGG